MYLKPFNYLPLYHCECLVLKIYLSSLKLWTPLRCLWMYFQQRCWRENWGDVAKSLRQLTEEALSLSSFSNGLFSCGRKVTILCNGYMLYSYHYLWKLHISSFLFCFVLILYLFWTTSHFKSLPFESLACLKFRLKFLDLSSDICWDILKYYKFRM